MGENVAVIVPGQRYSKVLLIYVYLFQSGFSRSTKYLPIIKLFVC